MAAETGWRSRIVGHGEAPPESLTGNPRNWRTHPRPQLDALAGVLSEVGWVQDVLVNRTTGHVVDGHARIQLALTRKEPTVPVVYVELSADEEAKVLATLDPLGAMAGADPERLAALVREVTADDAALRGVVQALADEHGLDLGGGGAPPEAPEPEIDRAEELREKWGTAPGQLWAIGRHRLLCGDCRSSEDVRRLCPEPVQGVFTSPPYAEQRKEQYGGVPVGEYVAWWEAVQANVREVLTPDGSFFVNLKPHCEDGERVLYVADLLLAMRRRWGWRFVDEFCWLKTGIPGKWPNRFKNAWESVYHFSAHDQIKFRPDAVAHPSDASFGYRADRPKSAVGFTRHTHFDFVAGQAHAANVISAHEEQGFDGIHAAPFPVALPSFFIPAFSDRGDTWVDPFSGSGTLLVAAQQHERVGYGMELVPEYAAVTLERLSQMGLEPRRAEA